MLSDGLMNTAKMDKAVVLARGLGTRMRKHDGPARLTAEQSAAADAGVKPMMPIDPTAGRPFLDYLLTAVADAGYRRICLVVGPEQEAVRAHYRGLAAQRVSIEFAVQAEPRGTADAVAAAEEFAAGEHFLAVNGDNYYPPEAMGAMRKLGGMGLAAFERDGMLAGGNVSPDRLGKFAVVRIDSRGYLTEIIEKPAPDVIAGLAEPVCVSMNCWRFGPAIFTACRAIPPSPRGELEITSAVQYAIDELGERFRALTFALPVLDLSSRSDVEPVARRLAGVEVDL